MGYDGGNCPAWVPLQGPLQRLVLWRVAHWSSRASKTVKGLNKMKTLMEWKHLSYNRHRGIKLFFEFSNWIYFNKWIVAACIIQKLEVNSKQEMQIYPLHRSLKAKSCKIHGLLPHRAAPPGFSIASATVYVLLAAQDLDLLLGFASTKEHYPTAHQKGLSTNDCWTLNMVEMNQYLLEMGVCMANIKSKHVNSFKIIIYLISLKILEPSMMH